MEAPLTITIWSLVLEDKRNKTWDGFIFRAEINVLKHTWGGVCPRVFRLLQVLVSGLVAHSIGTVGVVLVW